MATAVYSPAEAGNFNSGRFSPMGMSNMVLDNPASRGSLTSREKRTFKDKLHTMIQEAEAAEVQAIREAQLHDKKSLAIQMLVEGRPSGYVDFFNLTHTRTAAASSGAESTSGQDDVPQESLSLLKSELIQADNAARMGDSQAVYAAYKNLAKYFAEIGRLKKAEFFFQRCLQTSQEAQWLAGELEATLALGVVHEELQNTISAISCYERRLQLASENNMQMETDIAYQNLTAVYLRQAESQESSGNVAAAVDSYNRCLSAADKAGDQAAAARAHYRLGMLYHQQSKYTEATHYLGKFTELSHLLDDKAAEGLAYTTYASCLQESGDIEGAIRCLDQYLQVARAGEHKGPAVASCSLGILYFGQKDYEAAVTYFEKFFETARTLSDRKMLDTARVNLGVARGALRVSQYMHVVNSELPKLIQWKSSRVPFSDQ